MEPIRFIKPFQTYIGLSLFTLFLVLLGCKKWVEVPAPINSLNESNVYTNDAAAIGVLTGIYAKMSYNSYAQFDFDINDFSDISMSVLPGLSADELVLANGSDFLSAYYTNGLNSATASNSFWEKIYPVVFTCNAAIDGLDKSDALNPNVKQQLLGEAKFMRAFCYFYLVSLYGDVPLVLSTDYKVNTLLARAPMRQVYTQIILDLKEADALLNTNYLDATLTKVSNQRLRPTKWTAKSLLARAYLFSGDNSKAEELASEVISNTSMFNLMSLNGVFLSNSKEAIWQLQPVGNDIYSNTAQGRLFILPQTGLGYDFSTGMNHVYYLNDKLVSSFETGDQRKAHWTGNVTIGSDTYYFAYKYKVSAIAVPTSEYMMVLRLAEQYLIRAEARALQGNVPGAVADLNELRARARGGNPGDLPNLSTSLSQQQALDAVEKERRLELFTEWGHRWLDLKRTGKVNAVMSVETPLKGGSWSSNWSLYPVPVSEIQKSPNLTQNPGYQ